MQRPGPRAEEHVDKIAIKDILWLPLTFLGLKDDKEIRFIRGLRRFQQEKLLKWDFQSLTRKERLDLINEYSRSIYLRKHTKATNRLALVAVVIAGLNGCIAFENLKESRKASAIKSSAPKVFVTSLSNLKIHDGNLVFIPVRQIPAVHASIPSSNPR